MSLPKKRKERKAIGCRIIAEQRDLVPTTQPRGGNPRPSAHGLKCSTSAPPERTWYTQPPGSLIMDHWSLRLPRLPPCELERFLTTTTQRHEEHLIT